MNAVNVAMLVRIVVAFIVLYNTKNEKSIKCFYQKNNLFFSI